MKSQVSKNLNSDQLSAVKHVSGPLLIVAGAGTGKTTVITERVKWLIAEKLAKPEEILALTFTDKSAREMIDRIDAALPYGTFGLWISTFHSFCDRILRAEGLQIGLSSDFKLMTEGESYQFLKNNLWKLPLNYFRPLGNPLKFIQALLQHFSRLKDEDVSIGKYLEFAKSIKIPKSGDEILKEEKEKSEELAKCFEAYQNLKNEHGVMDFSDLIGNTLALFRTRKSVLEKYHKQFKYILVDEFQDTNFAQYELVKLLAPSGKNSQANLAVVGDDSQSIYKFRGAAISNILSFMKDYPNAKQIVLTKNYRTSQPILDSAYRLIRHNDPDTLEAKLGIDKNLKSEVSQKGFVPELLYFNRVEEEADQVIKKIQILKSENEEKYNWRDFAILVRANNHSDPFVKALQRSNIPHQFLGPGSLFQKEEVKDLIAYLKILYDPSDSANFYRVLSIPVWQISQRDLIMLLSQAKKINVSLFELIENPESLFGLSTGAKESLKKFMDIYKSHLELIPKQTAGQILYLFLEESGLIKKIVEYSSAEEESQAQNIAKFFDRLKSFETTHADSGVFAVVDYLDLALTMGESPLAAQVDWTENDAVNILTIHSAKGLEFPVVFLTNLIEGRFPSRERSDPIPLPQELIQEILPEGDYHLEEERRLFYVGMTRAKERLFFSAADFYGDGKRERKLSPFVYEALGETTLKKTETVGTPQLGLFDWDQNPNKNVSSQPKSQVHIDYLSYSRIADFKICPMHYKLKYILNISTPPSAAQSLGNSIHLALNQFYQLDIRDKKNLLELLKNNWIKAGYNSKQHEQESFSKAEKFLLTYLESDLHKNSKPISLEQSFTIKIDPTLKIGGKIDRVDDLGGGTIEIIDYKTGAKVPEQKDIDKDLQMGIYALAAIDQGKFDKTIDKVKLSFYYFDNAKKISTTRTLEQLAEVKKEILETRRQIEQSDFSCSKGIICKTCEYRMFCES